MGHNRKRANYLRLSRRSAGLHQHGSGRDAKVPRYGQERRRAEQEQLHGTLPGGKHGREGKRKSGGGVSDVVEAGKPGWLLEKTRLGDPPPTPTRLCAPSVLDHPLPTGWHLWRASFRWGFRGANLCGGGDKGEDEDGKDSRACFWAPGIGWLCQSLWPSLGGRHGNNYPLSRQGNWGLERWNKWPKVTV